MSISYNKLWKLLIDKKLNKTDLRIKADIGTSTLAKLSKDQPVSMSVIMKICEVLECDVDDVMEIMKADKNI
ncbi:MAG TPA: helix-turn-helix transcriptional regulator [Clostridia bacterium]|nr:helix-turn-helix transcriptional regulator [Clostridia bacterium]